MVQEKEGAAPAGRPSKDDPIGVEITSQNTAAQRDRQYRAEPIFSLYDGRRCLFGHVFEAKPSSFEATADDGGTLGRFPSVKAAEAAVLASRHGGAE